MPPTKAKKVKCARCNGKVHTIRSNEKIEQKVLHAFDCPRRHE